MVFISTVATSQRLFHGNENRIGDFAMRQPILRCSTFLALDSGSRDGVFNFVAAPAIFQWFERWSTPTLRIALRRDDDPRMHHRNG